MIRSPAKILALLTGLNLLNYLDRFVVSAVLISVSADLKLDPFEAGLLASVFLVSYCITSPIFGIMADRGRRTPLLTIGVLVWSIATIASGFAPNKSILFLARAFVGVGEASYASIAPTLIDDIAPPERKGRWLAIFFAATPLGSALGYILGGYLSQHYGWRSAFYVAGGPGVALALACLFIAEPPRVLAHAHESLIAVAKELWPIPLYRRAVLGYAAQTAAIGAFAHWAPTYIQKAHDLTEVKANVGFGGVTVIGGAIGTFVGGRLGDRLSKRDWGGRDETKNLAIGFMRVCAWGCAFGAPFAFLQLLMPSPGPYFVVVLVCEVGLFLSMSPINAAILRAVPENRRASAMALTILLIHVLGDSWSPSAVGLLAKHFRLGVAMMFLPVAIAVSAAIWWMPRKACESA